MNKFIFLSKINWFYFCKTCDFKYFFKKQSLIFLRRIGILRKSEFVVQKNKLKQQQKLLHSRLGIAYNVFDGEELLETSLKSVRSAASYIVVVYQIVSNYNEPASKELEPLLIRLKQQGLIDELYLYEPTFNHSDTHFNEKRKRDIGLQLVKKAGCDYFLSMDTDEFYHASQISAAIDFMYDEKIQCSAVSLVEYLKYPTYQMVNGYTFTNNRQNYNFYVPFIMKIHPFKKQKHNSVHFPCLVDPTRGLNCGEKFYLFSRHIVVMHHMCTIRRNLARKYNNSNLRRGFSDDRLADLQRKILNFDYEKNIVSISQFEDVYVQKVKNTFEIDIRQEISNA